MPSQKTLKEKYYYKDGQLYWKIRAPRINKGQVAGHKNESVNGYTRFKIRVDRKEYMLHRVIWVYHYGSIDPDKTIDHIDRNPLNNRIENLRLVTRSENQRNRSVTKKNISGIRGVHFVSAYRLPWRASIYFTPGKCTILGHFATREEAAAVRHAAEQGHGYL